MRKLILRSGFGALLSFGLLSAGTVGPSCSNCFGGLYSLDAVLVSGDVWHVTATYDLTGYTGGASSYISAVAFKVADSVTGLSNTSYWANTGSMGSWAASTSNLSTSGGGVGGGCGGSGSGFICFAAASR